MVSDSLYKIGKTSWWSRYKVRGILKTIIQLERSFESLHIQEGCCFYRLYSDGVSGVYMMF